MEDEERVKIIGIFYQVSYWKLCAKRGKHMVLLRDGRPSLNDDELVPVTPTSAE